MSTSWSTILILLGVYLHWEVSIAEGSAKWQWRAEGLGCPGAGANEVFGCPQNFLL